MPIHNHVLPGAASAVLALVEVRSFSEQTALFPASLYRPYQQRGAQLLSGSLAIAGIVIINKISRNGLGIYFYRVSVYLVVFGEYPCGSPGLQVCATVTQFCCGFIGMKVA